MTKTERSAYNNIAWNMSRIDNPDFMESVSELDYINSLEKEVERELKEKENKFTNLK